MNKIDPGKPEIIQAALRWEGTPYRHQASTLAAGCDCLGLVRGVWRTLYGSEPTIVPPYQRSGNDAEGAGNLIAAARHFLAEAESGLAPGLVIVFRLHSKLPPRHCGILLCETSFIHAQERVGVIITELDRIWRRRIHSCYAFPERS